MRKHKYSRFNRWWDGFDAPPTLVSLLFPISGSIFVVKVILIGILLLAILVELALLPSALRTVDRAFRSAHSSGQSEGDSTRLKGGEARQGSERKGSLVRPGGPLSSDDLRRRLYELRGRKPKGMASLTRNVGGQNGE